MTSNRLASFCNDTTIPILPAGGSWRYRHLRRVPLLPAEVDTIDTWGGRPSCRRKLTLSTPEEGAPPAECLQQHTELRHFVTILLPAEVDYRHPPTEVDHSAPPACHPCSGRVVSLPERSGSPSSLPERLGRAVTRAAQVLGQLLRLPKHSGKAKNCSGRAGKVAQEKVS